MTKFICAWVVVALVSTYGLWLNHKSGDKKSAPWELIGICIAVHMLGAVFFSALYMILFFTKTVWGMI